LPPTVRNPSGFPHCFEILVRPAKIPPNLRPNHPNKTPHLRRENSSLLVSRTGPDEQAAGEFEEQGWSRRTTVIGIHEITRRFLRICEKCESENDIVKDDGLYT
jgi:hypothetical protein